jgi:hypothetical protein
MPIQTRSLKDRFALGVAINPINKQPFYLIYKLKDGHPPRPIGAVTFELTATGFHLTEVIHATWMPFFKSDYIKTEVLAQLIDMSVVEFIDTVPTNNVNLDQYYAKMSFTGTAELRTIPRAYATGTVEKMTFVPDKTPITQALLTSMISDVPALLNQTVSSTTSADILGSKTVQDAPNVVLTRVVG